MLDRIKIGKNNQPAAQFIFEDAPEAETETATRSPRNETRSREVLLKFIREPEQKQIFEDQVSQGMIQADMGTFWDLSVAQVKKLEGELGLSDLRKDAPRHPRTWRHRLEDQVKQLEDKINTLADDLQELRLKA
jgi:hypothetical protein